MRKMVQEKSPPTEFPPEKFLPIKLFPGKPQSAQSFKEK